MKQQTLGAVSTDFSVEASSTFGTALNSAKVLCSEVNSLTGATGSSMLQDFVGSSFAEEGVFSSLISSEMSSICASDDCWAFSSIAAKF